MKLTYLLTTLLAMSSHALFGLVIPSDSSDGALNPAADVEIDLSQAVTGTWSDDNTGINIGKGVYDADQWAIVFEYSSVNIPEGVTVSFANHPSNPPVIWLVSGDVTIDGTVSLKGISVYESGLEGLVPSSAGPGGFRGGASGPEGDGKGIGPGGAGATGGDADPVYRSGIYEYGNPQIIPLIGGSGGRGTALTAGSGGGGGLLIASAGTINLNGTVDCSGGNHLINYQGNRYRGTGGSARLIAENILGTGTVDCRGGFWVMSGPTDTAISQGGSEGRIRIEANTFSTGINMYPETVAVSPGAPVQLFAPGNAPTIEIVSVDSINAPADPTAPLQANSDIAIQNNGAVTVIIQTTNFPVEGVVQLRVGEKFGEAQWLTASYSSGTLTSALWIVTHTFTDGFSALQARATAP